MAESQSRYSIVERLTQQKLKIIDTKANLSAGITLAKQEVETLKKGLTDWEKDVKEDVIRTRRLRDRKIEEAETNLNNATEQKEQKEETCDKKLEAIEAALTKLQAISEAAES